jgi:hypothetical protein
MKTILTSIAAGSLLAALAVAQPSRPAAAANPATQFHGRWVAMTARTRDVPASADRSLLVYIVTNGLQFGTEDLRSGAFVPIGPGLPPQDGGVSLFPSPAGSLLTLAFTGDLVAIDPATGAASLVGATGLGNCSPSNSSISSTSFCPPNSAGFLGKLGDRYYATDFANNLYSVDPETGATRLIGPTGLPAIMVTPTGVNPDGTFTVYDESLFSFRGKLYTNFDIFTVDPNTGKFTEVIPDALYEINPNTGQATWIASTALALITIVSVDDTVYGFDGETGQIATIDMTSGQTTAVSEIDPAIIIAVCGATPARPAPASR